MRNGSNISRSSKPKYT